jgi:hypothetical protein
MKKIPISEFGVLARAFHVVINAALGPTLLFILAANSTHAAIDAVRIATGFENPLGLATPPGDTGRLFVVEQTGKIRIINLATRTVNATPFLDVSAEITDDGNEQGLLGLAFDPNYATNGRFYIARPRPADPSALGLATSLS